jgi:hypothetical protein
VIINQMEAVPVICEYFIQNEHERGA